MVTAQRHPYWVLKDKASQLPSFLASFHLSLSLYCLTTHPHAYAPPTHTHTGSPPTHTHTTGPAEADQYFSPFKEQNSENGFSAPTLQPCFRPWVFFFSSLHKTTNLQSGEFNIYFFDWLKIIAQSTIFIFFISILSFDWVYRSVLLCSDPRNTLHLCVTPRVLPQSLPPLLLLPLALPL